jgi:serine/threonine-protein kinase
VATETPPASLVDEGARRRFETAWKEGRPEPVEHFLPAAERPTYLATLEELIHIELEFAWKAWRRPGAGPAPDRPPRLEDYLARFPRLNQPAIALRLLEQEYRVRQRYGDRPSSGEYRARFPQLIVTDQDLEGSLPRAGAEPEGLPQIPGYELLGLLGRGGMGVVYKARQVRLKRLVALKMILAGPHAEPEQTARFRAEAEAVAQLQHPHIVQIYEVGEHGGLPYFSLEFVDGGSLDKHLAGAPRPPRPAAQLVETLARAMHCAHERGIVHRDLKPANILLRRKSETRNPKSETNPKSEIPRTETPSAPRLGFENSDLEFASDFEFRISDFEPKITDFGLAKRLEGDAGQTRTGAIMGTPSYMAPEQAQGKTKQVGPTADVYALGVILYEMLTGRPPFRGETAWDTVQQVLTEEPVSLTRLQPRVPRDLETICLKCLAKEPGKRYPSAQALADDLRRFLASESIHARPTPAWERGVKWARRRPALAALLGVSGTAALTVLVVVLVANARLQAERDDARAARQEAEVHFRAARDAVDQMLTRLGDERLAHVPQMELLRRDLLGDALRFYQQFLEHKSTDPAVRLETGRAHRRMADIHKLLDQHAGAEQHYRHSLAALDRLADEYPGVADHRAELASSHNNLGLLLESLGRLPEAEQAYRQGLDLLRPLADEFPTEPQYQEKAAGSSNNLGNVLADTGRHRESEQAYRRAVEVYTRLAADFPTVPAYQRKLATSQHNLGQQLVATNRLPEAEAVYRQALAVMERLVADGPHDTGFRQGLARCHTSLGLLLGDTARPGEAEKALRQALDTQARLAADYPHVPAYRQYHAGALTNLGHLLQRTGRPGEAEEALGRARELQAKLVADFPRVPAYRLELAASHQNLGLLWQAVGRHEEAEKAFVEARQRLEQLAAEQPAVPSYRFELSKCHAALGDFLAARGRLPEGANAFRQAVGLLEQLAADFPGVPSYRQRLALNGDRLASLLRQSGRLPEAAAVYRQTLQARERLAADFPGEPRHQTALADTLNDLAHCLVRDAGELREARQLLERALRHLHACLERNPDQAEARRSLRNCTWYLALTLVRLEEHEAAARAAAELPRIFPQSWQEYHHAGWFLATCGILAAKDGRLSESERSTRAGTYADQAVELLRQAVQRGYADAEDLKKNPAYAALRRRDDFRRLQAELAGR